MSDSKTEKLLSDWASAERRYKAARKEMETAAIASLKATNELGEWLTPDDRKKGEKFHIWINGALLEISPFEVERDGFLYTIKWRETKERKGEQ